MEKKYTDGTNKDFILLCQMLDEYLNEVVGGEKQKTQYVQYNTLESIHDVLIIYEEGKAIACGSFKEYEPHVAELKRVYVRKENRRGGMGQLLLEELEKAAKAKGYSKMILETGKPLVGAISFYKKMGFEVIPNYGQYKEMKESVCMAKCL